MHDLQAKIEENGMQGRELSLFYYVKETLHKALGDVRGGKDSETVLLKEKIRELESRIVELQVRQTKRLPWLIDCCCRRS